MARAVLPAPALTLAQAWTQARLPLWFQPEPRGRPAQRMPQVQRVQQARQLPQVWPVRQAQRLQQVPSLQPN